MSSEQPFDAKTSEPAFENRLRPKRFEDFPGQEQLCHNLRVYIEAARKRGEPLDHILFSGPQALPRWPPRIPPSRRIWLNR